MIQNSALNMSCTSRTDWWNNALNSSRISLVSDQNVKYVQPLFNLKDLLTPSERTTFFSSKLVSFTVKAII